MFIDMAQNENDKQGLMPGLAHYTMSDFLNLILKENLISLKASCVRNFWKNEIKEQDDSQELKYAATLLRIRELELRGKEKGSSKMGELISSHTQYITCFTKSVNDRYLFHRMCNNANGYPVMLNFDVSKLLRCLDPDYSAGLDGSSNSGKSDKDYSRIDFREMQYSESDAEEHIKDAYEVALMDLKALDIPGNGEGDNRIDACFFVKRKKYHKEREVRCILQRKKSYTIRVTEDDKLDFGLSDNNGNDDCLYLELKKECLQEIRFAPCISESAARKIIKENNIYENYPNVRIKMFDGTDLRKE